MPRYIIPARFPAGDAPDIQGMVYAPAGQTFVIGAPLVFNGSQQVIEATSPITTAVLLGVAMQGVDTNPGYQAANTPVNITYRSGVVSVARANRITVFSGNLVNGSSALVTPVQTDIGVNYGLKSYVVATMFGNQNVWFVDRSQTAGNACVTVVAIDTTAGNQIVFFKFMEARLALP
jgi:hypothetical protein